MRLNCIADGNNEFTGDCFRKRLDAERSAAQRVLDHFADEIAVLLARLSKFFGFLRFSAPRAVKTHPGAQKGAPNPKLGSPDGGRNLAKNVKD